MRGLNFSLTFFNWLVFAAWQRLLIISIDKLVRVIIHSKTSLSSAILFIKLDDAPHLYCTSFLIRTENVPHSYCTSSPICTSQSFYRGEGDMQLNQPHSYTLINIIFLENLLLTIRLCVSFYQSANI